MLQNEHLVSKIGVDTAENELLDGCCVGKNSRKKMRIYESLPEVPHGEHRPLRAHAFGAEDAARGEHGLGEGPHHILYFIIDVRHAQKRATSLRLWRQFSRLLLHLFMQRRALF